MRAVHFLGLVVFVLGFTGCDGDGLKRVQVEGKLTAKGQLVDQATIVFLPVESTKGLGGIARSDQDGNFSVSSTTESRKPVRGIVPGEYNVQVSRLVARDGKVLPPDAAPDMDYPGYRETIPLRYASNTSPLRVTVPESGGQVNVEIPQGLVKEGVQRR